MPRKCSAFDVVNDAKRRQAQATKEPILMRHRYHSPSPAFPRQPDYQPKIRIKPPYISRNSPIFASELPSSKHDIASELHHIRQCYYSIVIRLLFDCYSIIERRTIEYKTRKDRGKSSAVTRQGYGCYGTKQCYHGKKTIQRTITDWETAPVGHNGL